MRCSGCGRDDGTSCGRARLQRLGAAARVYATTAAAAAAANDGRRRRRGRQQRVLL